MNPADRLLGHPAQPGDSLLDVGLAAWRDWFGLRT
jgi:hypothetical protein